MSVPGRKSPGDGDGDGDGRSDFEKAMAGVKRLRGGPAVRPPAAPTGRRSGATRAIAAAPVAFEVQVRGERVAGRAPGIDRRALARLKSGEFTPDARLNLHGLRAADARRALRECIEAAWEEGHRCVLVVHGRGAHSEAGPVLKRALLEWLAEPPVGERVMAFASAPAAQGGPGATQVLLRRRRPGR